MKQCKRCHIEKPLDDYYVVRAKNKRRDWCKKCVKECVLQWQKDNPDKVAAKFRRSKLKLKYGITVADVQEMLDAQHGVCAVCGSRPEAAQSLCVDHCHATGQVRGLLCHKCNTGIGFLGDDSELMRRAAAYISIAGLNKPR